MKTNMHFWSYVARTVLLRMRNILERKGKVHPCTGSEVR